MFKSNASDRGPRPDAAELRAVVRESAPWLSGNLRVVSQRRGLPHGDRRADGDESVRPTSGVDEWRGHRRDLLPAAQRATDEEPPRQDHMTAGYISIHPQTGRTTMRCSSAGGARVRRPDIDKRDPARASTARHRSDPQRAAPRPGGPTGRVPTTTTCACGRGCSAPRLQARSGRRAHFSSDDGYMPSLLVVSCWPSRSRHHGSRSARVILRALHHPLAPPLETRRPCIF